MTKDELKLKLVRIFAENKREEYPADLVVNDEMKKDVLFAMWRYVVENCPFYVKAGYPTIVLYPGAVTNRTVSQYVPHQFGDRFWKERLMDIVIEELSNKDIPFTIEGTSIFIQIEDLRKFSNIDVLGVIA